MQREAVTFHGLRDAIVVRCDASMLGVGAALLNLDGEEEKMIAFTSKSFKDASSRWSVIEQECYGIVHALTSFEPMLMGFISLFNVIIETCNGYTRQRTKTDSLGLRIQGFQFTIQHIPGTSNTFADQSSRLEVKKLSIRGVESDEPVTDAIQRFHNAEVGHKSAQTILRLLRQAGYDWETMASDIQSFVASCSSCQKRLLPPDEREVNLHSHRTYEPFELISIDTLGPLPDAEGYRYIIVFICYTTKVAWLYPTKNTTAQEAVNALNHLTGRIGVVREIMSDQGHNSAIRSWKHIACLEHPAAFCPDLFALE